MTQTISVLYLKKEVDGERPKSSVVAKPLSQDVLLKMIGDFKLKRYKPLLEGKPGSSSETKKVESRSCWFPKKLLKELLEKPNTNGLRLYFGLHHYDDQDPDKSSTTHKDYHDCQTIIICPTNESGGTEENIDNEREVLEVLIGGRDRPGEADDGGSLCPPPPTGSSCPGCTLMELADQALQKSSESSAT